MWGVLRAGGFLRDELVFLFDFHYIIFIYMSLRDKRQGTPEKNPVPPAYSAAGSQVIGEMASTLGDHHGMAVHRIYRHFPI